MAKIGDIQHRLIPAIALSKADGFVDSKGFEAARKAAAQTPLLEIAPAGFGDAPAALGFALAWMKMAWVKTAAENGLILWAAPEHSFTEFGAPYAEGLAQYGVDPRKLVLVRTQNQLDALWTAEQALTLPCAQVLCTISPSPKSLSLAASRRLLLNAEKSGAHCVLLRLDELAPSASRSRWRISAAPSQAHDHGFNDRELGAPAFKVQLERNRASPAGQTWRVDWNAHDHSFTERPLAEAANDSERKPVAGAVSAAPLHRPPTLYERRTG